MNNVKHLSTNDTYISVGNLNNLIDSVKRTESFLNNGQTNDYATLQKPNDQPDCWAKLTGKLQPFAPADLTIYWEWEEWERYDTIPASDNTPIKWRKRSDGLERKSNKPTTITIIHPAIEPGNITADTNLAVGDIVLLRPSYLKINSTGEDSWEHLIIPLKSSGDMIYKTEICPTGIGGFGVPLNNGQSMQLKKFEVGYGLMLSSGTGLTDVHTAHSGHTLLNLDLTVSGLTGIESIGYSWGNLKTYKGLEFGSGFTISGGSTTSKCDGLVKVDLSFDVSGITGTGSCPNGSPKIYSTSRGLNFASGNFLISGGASEGDLITVSFLPRIPMPPNDAKAYALFRGSGSGCNLTWLEVSGC